MVMRECEVPCFWVSDLMFLRAIGYPWTVASSYWTEFSDRLVVIRHSYPIQMSWAFQSEPWFCEAFGY